jgi:hypothetical protein
MARQADRHSIKIGSREHEQAGKKRAVYGAELLILLSTDLTKCFGRGFGVDNLERARKFYLTFVSPRKSAMALRKSQEVAFWCVKLSAAR